MSNKINEILDYGLLSELVYLTLESNYFKIELDNIYTNQNIKDYLGAKDNQLIKGLKLEADKDFYSEYKDAHDYRDIKPLRVKSMMSLLDRYTIIDFTSDDDGWLGIDSDFQAMLLKSKGAGKYIIAFRGTESFTDGLVDAKIANIFGGHNYQENEAVEFVENMKKKYSISDSNLILTGHSLGGILAQSLGAKLKIVAFAYNPLGTSSLVYNVGPAPINLLYELLDKLDIIDVIDENWVNENILTISYNDVGNLNGDILSNIATKLNGSKHLGMKIDIFGEDKGLSAHGMSGLNEILALQKEENLVTIADIRAYNNNEKTLLLDAMKQRKIDVLLTIVKNKKCLFAVQTTQEIKSIIMSNNSLIENLNHENVDSLRVNGTVTELEDKDNFNNKLYYNYEKNMLKVKTKDFKEAADLSRIVLNENEKLRRKNIKIEIQGEE